MELAETEIPDGRRTAALTRARGHWLLALAELEEPERRPGLVLMAGLPGSGKSTLARALAEHGDFTVVRIGRGAQGAGRTGGATRTALPFEEGIYTPEWTERTYAECLRRAEALLFEGRHVIVDASFSEDDAAAHSWRRPRAGAYRACCFSARWSRRWPGSAWRDGATMHPTLAGPFT